MAFKFKADDRVVHATFGAGKVVALHDVEQGDIYTVLFDNSEFNTKANAEQLEGDLVAEGDESVTELGELGPETNASDTDPPTKAQGSKKKGASKKKAAPKAKKASKAKAKFAKGDRVACSLVNDEKAKITAVKRMEDDTFQYEVKWENAEVKLEGHPMIEEINLSRARPKHVSPKEKARLGEINTKRLSQLALARKNLADKRAAERANQLVATSEAPADTKAASKTKKTAAA